LNCDKVMMINRQIWQEHHLMAFPVLFSGHIHTIYRDQPNSREKSMISRQNF